MVKIGFVTVSDRASRGEYEDLSGPAMEAWLKSAVVTPYETIRRVIPDGMGSVRDTLIDLCDNEACDLILTTGGTGPSPRDETPEAMQAVLHKELPGFGELMRRVSWNKPRPPFYPAKRQAVAARASSSIFPVNQLQLP